MPQVEKLLIFLASPSDVSTERKYVEEVIAELNRTVAHEKNIVLQVIKWETNAHPGYGKDAQALVNEQIAEMSKYALFIGLMWNRIGTPTPRSKSGTVEEFNLAKEALQKTGQPEIWFYFRNSASTLTTLEQLDQRTQVIAFKHEVEANGIPFSYSKTTKFKEMFRNQMVIWLDRRKKEERTKQSANLSDEIIKSTMSFLMAVQYAERRAISQQDYDLAYRKWEVEKEVLSNQLRKDRVDKSVTTEWDELAEAVTQVYALSGTYDKTYRAQVLNKITTYLRDKKIDSKSLLNYENRSSQGKLFHAYFNAWWSIREELIVKMKEVVKKIENKDPV